MSDSVRPHKRQPTRLPRPWDSPGKNIGVVFHFLLQCMKVKSLSCVWLFVTPWTAAYQAPPSMGFPRQEYWRGVPLPSQTLHVLIYTFSGTLHVHLILIAALKNSQLHRNQRQCNLPIMSQLGWKELRVRSSFSWSQIPCSQMPCSQWFFSSRQRYKSSLKP